ncbi:MAG: histidine kinase [Sulfurisoma sp.]|nr:histidine kinase [Sulfurisoma sp.]
MQAAKRPFERVSLSRQFLLVSALVLFAGMVGVGTWLGRQIEQNAIHRAALMASVYVESILGAQMDDWVTHGALTGHDRATLDRIFIDGPLSRKVVRFKLWDTAGKIIYSSDPALVGLGFPVGGRLLDAFRGTLQAHVSKLEGPDHRSERQQWEHLLEVYVPFRRTGLGEVIAVAEFYHSMTNIDHEIDDAKQRSWLLVAFCALAIQAVLHGFVRRANNTIVEQQRDLREQLRGLQGALEENERMRQGLRDAGAQTTALNEELLHRIAADLHDGPAQELAFALMRFEDLMQDCDIRRRDEDRSPRDLESIRRALRSSLDELRGIAAGLGIPGIAELTLADTIRRAVRDVERKSAASVEASIDAALGDAPMAVKITAYRLLQESLANALRHSPGRAPHVLASLDNAELLLEITDQGGGFDLAAAENNGRLGVAFMRERVRLLGGDFQITPSASGTLVRARLPLSPRESLHD